LNSIYCSRIEVIATVPLQWPIDLNQNLTMVKNMPNDRYLNMSINAQKPFQQLSAQPP
jgi:hypothetical protein